MLDWLICILPLSARPFTSQMPAWRSKYLVSSHTAQMEDMRPRRPFHLAEKARIRTDRIDVSRVLTMKYIGEYLQPLTSTYRTSICTRAMMRCSL
jgi:hypothetical protein